MRPSLRRRHLILIISLAAGLKMTPRAWATTPAEAAARRQLIEEAEAAHAAGDHAKALTLAQKALVLEATTSLRYFIAREEDETGALADAYATAQQCKLEAQRDLRLRNREQILASCQAIEDKLKERVGYVVVMAPNPPEGLKVRLSGQNLNEAMLGIPYVITPGTITVEATAPGHFPYRLEISVSEGKTVNVSVTLAPQPPTTTPGSSCPVGQRLGPGGGCVTDSCQIGMIRTPDALHCCWPGQSYDGARGCVGTAICPDGTHAEGGGCTANEAPLPGSPTDAQPRPTTQPMGTVLNVEEQSPGARERRRDPLGLWVAAAGAAVAVGGGVIWLISDSDYRSAKQSCNSPMGCTLSDYNSSVTTIQRLDNVATVSLIGGGALMLAGGLYYFLSGAAEPDRRDTRQARVDFNPVTRSFVLGVTF